MAVGVVVKVPEGWAGAGCGDRRAGSAWAFAVAGTWCWAAWVASCACCSRTGASPRSRRGSGRATAGGCRCGTHLPLVGCLRPGGVPGRAAVGRRPRGGWTLTLDPAFRPAEPGAAGGADRRPGSPRSGIRRRRSSGCGSCLGGMSNTPVRRRRCRRLSAGRGWPLPGAAWAGCCLLICGCSTWRRTGRWQRGVGRVLVDVARCGAVRARRLHWGCDLVRLGSRLEPGGFRCRPAAQGALLLRVSGLAAVRDPLWRELLVPWISLRPWGRVGQVVEVGGDFDDGPCCVVSSVTVWLDWVLGRTDPRAL